MSVSKSIIDKNLKAAANEAEKVNVSPPVQMKNVDEMYPPQDETIVAQKFKVKASPTRSPAPLPDAISPAGVPIAVEMKNKSSASSPSPLRKTITSPVPDDEVKIEIAGLEDLDLTVEGIKTAEYKRNKKGTAIVAVLLIIGFNLFVNHWFMFSYVVEFASSQVAVASVFYFISSFFVLGTMAASLVKPAFSIGDPDSLYKFYFLIAVAGLLDLLAIMLGGSIFGPFIIYSQYSYSHLNMDTVAILLSVLLNAGLFIGFTQPDGSASAKYFHPFERINCDTQESDSQIQEDLMKERESVV